MTFSRRAALPVLTLAAAGLALAGCSSSSSGAGPTTTVTTTTTASPSDSPTASPTGSASPTSTATSSPTTVTPTPTGSLLPIVLALSSTTFAPDQRITLTMSTDPSLAGKEVAVVKTTDGTATVISTGSKVDSSGKAVGYLVLQSSGTVQAVVPALPLPKGPFDPSTPLLAASAQVPVTVS